MATTKVGYPVHQKVRIVRRHIVIGQYFELEMFSSTYLMSQSIIHFTSFIISHLLLFIYYIFIFNYICHLFAIIGVTVGRLQIKITLKLYLKTNYKQ